MQSFIHVSGFEFLCSQAGFYWQLDFISSGGGAVLGHTSYLSQTLSVEQNISCGALFLHMTMLVVMWIKIDDNLTVYIRILSQLVTWVGAK